MADDMELKLRIEAVLKGFEELNNAAKQVTNLGEAARSSAAPGLAGMLNQMDPLAGKTAEAGAEFGRLMDKLDPLQAHANAFAHDLDTLNAAFKDGQMSQEEYGKRVNDLDKYYQTLEPRARAAADAIHSNAAAEQEAANGGAKLKETLIGLAESLGIIMGLREVGRVLKEMVLEGATEEHMFSNLALAEQMFANATKEDIEQGEKWVTWLRQTYNVANDEIVPAYQRLVAITKDVGEAQTLMEVAAGAAKEGFMSLTDASTVLTRYLETGVVMRGVDPVSNALREGKAAGEDFATILQTRLVPAFAEAGKAVHDHQTELNDLSASWKDAKAQMGGMLGGVLDGIPIVKAMIGVLEVFVLGLSTVGAMARFAGQAIAANLALPINAARDGVATAVAVFKDEQKEAADDLYNWMKDTNARMKALDIDIGISTAPKPGAGTATGAGAGNADYWREVELADKKELDIAGNSSAKRIEIFKREAAIARVTFGESSEQYAEAMKKLIAETQKSAEAASASAKRYASEVKAALQAMGLGSEGLLNKPLPLKGMGGESESKLLDKQIEAYFKEGQAARQAYEADAKWVEGLIKAHDPAAEVRAEIERLNKALKEGAITQTQYAQAEALLYTNCSKQMDALAKKNDETSKFAAAAWKKASEEIEHSLAQFLFGPFAKGTKGMLSEFVDMLHKMVSEALAASIMKALFGDQSGGGGGSIWASLFGAIFGGHMGENATGMEPAYGHTGGMAEALSGTGPATMLAMLGAPRLHAGALLGLQSDEIPAILQRGEEVLSKSSPRNIMNGGGAGGGTRIVNVWDTQAVGDYMTSSSGEHITLNHIRRNAGAINQLLARG